MLSNVISRHCQLFHSLPHISTSFSTTIYSCLPTAILSHRNPILQHVRKGAIPCQVLAAHSNQPNSHPTFQNPAIWLYGPNNAKLENHAVPEISDPHDVIIRINYIGTCGTDVHFWSHGGFGGPASVSADKPLVMGHEASGTVHTVGSAVTTVQAGDRVALEPGFPCRRCARCREGSYNLCPEMRFAASPPDAHGTLCKFFRLPEDFVYKLPDGVGLEEGALVEPTAVAVHMNRLVNVGVGEKVVVFGGGTVGLLCAAVAKAFGAGTVVLVDVLQSKLEYAKKFVKGCGTYIPGKGVSAEENAKRLNEQFGLEEGADVVLEATGAEPCIQTGIFVVRSGGRYVQGGLGKLMCEFPIVLMSTKELTVKGCFRYYGGDFKIALDLISGGKLAVKDLVTTRMDFEQATEAWEVTKRGEGIKTMIRGVKD